MDFLDECILEELLEPQLLPGLHLSKGTEKLSICPRNYEVLNPQQAEVICAGYEEDPQGIDAKTARIIKTICDPVGPAALNPAL